MNKLSDYEIEDFGGILMIRIHDPEVLTEWIRVVAREEDFDELLKKSPEEQVGAVMSGSTQSTKFNLTVTYSFRVEVFAGKVVEGSAIILFPNGEEQKRKADKIMTTLITMVAVLYKT